MPGGIILVQHIRKTQLLNKPVYSGHTIKMPHAESPKPEDTFFVNDGPLDPDQVGYLKPTALDTPLEEVRHRLKADGYVFLKGLLPKADVLSMRESYFSLLSPSGVLAPNTAAVDGIFNPTANPLDYPGIGAGGTEANGRPTGPDPSIASAFVDLALQAHYEPWYKDVFCRHPALHSYIANLTGWGASNTHGVRRTLLRNNTPGNNAIGVHYDQIFLRHGEDTNITAWIPIGDISLQGGGLIYLEQGHTLGAELERDFTAKAAKAGLSDEETRSAFNRNMLSGGVLEPGARAFGRKVGRKWLVAEYEAGDVMLHDAYAIHASTVNHDPQGRIRLGTDLRFVDTRRPWDTRWDQDFRFGDGV
jgi:phytanoyl-CoA hydroxylase